MKFISDEIIEIVTLATFNISAIIAIIHAIDSLIKKKTVKKSLNLFVNSFLGGLLGGLIGAILGYILGYLVSLIIPGTGGFIFSDVEKWIGFILVYFICWLVGVITGGIITIKPVIRFFLDKYSGLHN